MRLFSKIQKAETRLSPAFESEMGKFYYQRRPLALLGLGASLLLLAWGYVIMPRNGPGFWLWLLTTLATIGGAAYLFRQQIQRGRRELEKQGEPLTSPRFRWSLGLILILIAGLAANLIVVFANPQPLRFDAWGYSDQGYNIAQQGYKADAIRTPGYPFFVSLVYKLTRDTKPLGDPIFGLSDPPNRNMIALWLVQSLLLSLTVLLVYLSVSEIIPQTQVKTKPPRRVYVGQPLPLLAAGLVAFCPFLWGYTGTPQTEICSAFWLTLTVYCWVKTLRSRQVALYYLLTGLALAWNLETRPTFLFLPLVVLATLVLLGRGRWRLFGPMLVLIALLLILIPPFAANLRDWNEPTPLIAGDLSTYQTTLGTLNVIRGGMPRYQRITTPADTRLSTEDRARLADYVPIQQQPDQAKRQAESAYWKHYFSTYLSNYPLEFGGTMLQRAWFQWDQHFVFPYYDPAYWDYRWLTDNLNRLYLIFALVGLGVAFVRRPYRWATLPLYATIFYLMGLNLLVQDEFRYTLPAYPLMLIFAALGLWEVIQAILKIRRANREKLENVAPNSARPLRVLIGLGVSLLFILALSLALPLIPTTTAAREKALDAVYASQNQSEGCYYKSASSALEQAVSLDGQDGAVRKWQQQFPKEVAYTITNLTRRLEIDSSGTHYNYYRCRGEAYLVAGQLEAARADFQLFLKYAPADARERSKFEGWLSSKSGLEIPTTGS
ncbi:MAG: glycosyltransferase family 39 protein [Chloroflexi bacterium]|nr:glycosyltransferase family 39 protein [Chloroflexota bacterium]